MPKINWPTVIVTLVVVAALMRFTGLLGGAPRMMSARGRNGEE